MSARVATVLLIASLAAACGDDATTTTSPSSTTATTTTVTFLGSLVVGGSRFYSFTLSSAGIVSVMLASVTSPSTGVPLAHALEIAVGVPAGTGCAPMSAQTVVPTLSSQLSVSLQTGTFCIRVADVGELTQPVNFALRFTHP